MNESSTFLSKQSASAEGISRAAVYARTSSQNQRFGYSLSEQVRQCLKKCRRVGWEVTHLCRDEAESGKDTNRPMFQTMMRRAKEERFDVVVFWKLDRFSRSLLHAVQLEAELREYGVALYSVTEHIDTTTSAGRFNFRNIASAAEFERDMIQERTQMGLQALAAERKWPNDSPPLGYQRQSDGTLEVVPREAELVQYIFEKYLDIRSMPEVACRLNEADYSTKKGNGWTTKAVGDVLRNELYRGRYSIATVNEYVEEYRIIPETLFEKVTEVRHRFQQSEGEPRGEMTPTRKREHVESVKKQYEAYLFDDGDKE